MKEYLLRIQRRKRGQPKAGRLRTRQGSLSSTIDLKCCHDYKNSQRIEFTMESTEIFSLEVEIKREIRDFTKQ